MKALALCSTARWNRPSIWVAEPLLIGQHLRILIGQLAGEGDLVGLPCARFACVLQAENADYLPTDSNAGVQDRANSLRAIDKLVKFAGAVILGHVLRIDGATALQRLQVAGKGCEFQG